LIWINRGSVELRHASRAMETPMTTNQFYFVLLVLASFSGFGFFLAASYVRYRRWLAKQPNQLL
jgi:hypothetical protein